jgi:hypothetical protein
MPLIYINYCDYFFLQTNFIQKNATFLLHTVLSLAQHRLEEVRLHPNAAIAKLRSDFEWLSSADHKITKSEQSFV